MTKLFEFKIDSPHDRTCHLSGPSQVRRQRADAPSNFRLPVPASLPSLELIAGFGPFQPSRLFQELFPSPDLPHCCVSVGFTPAAQRASSSGKCSSEAPPPLQMFLIVLNLGGGAPASHDRPPARDVSTVSLRETLFGLDDEGCMVEKFAIYF